jgi:poly(A) polymerase
VYLVGGIVRDLVAGTSPESDASDETVKNAMKDVDIVSTSHPQIGVQMAEEIGGVNVKDKSEWGVAQVLDGMGLDVSSIASRESNNFKKGQGIYDHDLEDDIQRRDFTANCMFYDVYNDVIIDPTGQGYADAQAKVLRLAPTAKNAEKNLTLPLRFWKFRMRGWKTEAKTLEFMKKQLAKMPPDVISNELYKIMKKGGDKKANWAKLRNAMKEDGAYDLYKKYIKPFKYTVPGV